PKPASPATKAALPPTAAKSAKAKAATPAAAPGALTTDDEKTIYALGLSMAQQLNQMGITAAEYNIIKQALTDSAAGKPALEVSAWQAKFGPFTQARSAKMA